MLEFGLCCRFLPRRPWCSNLREECVCVWVLYSRGLSSTILTACCAFAGSQCTGLFSTTVLGGSSSAPNLQDYARSHGKKFASSFLYKDGTCILGGGSSRWPRPRWSKKCGAPGQQADTWGPFERGKMGGWLSLGRMETVARPGRAG